MHLYVSNRRALGVQRQHLFLYARDVSLALLHHCRLEIALPVTWNLQHLRQRIPCPAHPALSLVALLLSVPGFVLYLIVPYNPILHHLSFLYLSSMGKIFLARGLLSHEWYYLWLQSEGMDIPLPVIETDTDVQWAESCIRSREDHPEYYPAEGITCKPYRKKRGNQSKQSHRCKAVL